MEYNRELIDKHVTLALNIGAALFIVLILLRGLLIQLGSVDTPYIMPPLLYWTIIGALVPISIIQLLFRAKTKREALMRLVAFYVSGSAILFFITGIDSPYASFWFLIILASYTEFGRKGVYLSVGWFIILTIIAFGFDFLVKGELSFEYFITVGVILCFGLVINAIARLQDDRMEQVISSKVSEGVQRDSLHIVINNLTNAVLSVDNTGKISLFNAAAANLFNTNVSMTGRSIDDVVQFTNPDGTPFSTVAQLQKTYHDVVFDDLRLRYNNDDEIRVEMTISPIRSDDTGLFGPNERQGFIVIAHDVTKSKTLDEEKDEFVSVVSHELRTPITTAEGAVSNLILMLDHPDVDVQMKKDAAEQAHKEIIFLSKMINDLSTLSRAERGSHDAPEVVDLKDLINTLYNEFSEQARNKSLRLDLDLDPELGSVFLSRLYLEELLQNLVGNAIKYTVTGGVKISAHVNNEQVTISVIDTGIGISQSEQSKIFTKFYRVEDYRTRESSGSGLGLYLAKRLADKIGTEIKLESRLNNGSTFTITLPSYKATPTQQVDLSR